MNAGKSQGASEIAEMIGSVRSKGIELWSENGQLRYRAPKGVLTSEDIEKLRSSRGQIVALLEGANSAAIGETRVESRLLVRAPLSFSQLAHWNLYQLRERHAIRQIASVRRLRGHLNLTLLRMSIGEIIRRHDVLRTRIVILDGVPIQEIRQSSDCELEVDDLIELSEGLREIEVKRQIDKFILEPIDVAVDSLIGVRLLRTSDDEHVLIVAMEHMISDMFSMNILLRELFTAYTQAFKGAAFSLPPITAQFLDYVLWQHHAQSRWLEEHGAYWEERLRGCQRLRFPEDKGAQTATCSGWKRISFQIGADLKIQLSEWCRVRRTTLVMCIFTAYVAAVLRWCNAAECVIQYQSNGRVSSDVENTIGYFASALYLRITLLDGDSFVDLMHRVTEEYCKAYEHADFAYMSAQIPRPEFTRNTAFNWISRGSRISSSELVGLDPPVESSPISFEHPMLTNLHFDAEPFVEISEFDDEIIVQVYFPVVRFSISTMERFGRSFMSSIEALRMFAEARVKNIPLL